METKFILFIYTSRKIHLGLFITSLLAPLSTLKLCMDNIHRMLGTLEKRAMRCNDNVHFLHKFGWSTVRVTHSLDTSQHKLDAENFSWQDRWSELRSALHLHFCSKAYENILPTFTRNSGKSPKQLSYQQCYPVFLRFLCSAEYWQGQKWRSKQRQRTCSPDSVDLFSNNSTNALPCSTVQPRC